VKYLLDTNVISEMEKPGANPKVKAFLNNLPAEDLLISVLSMGEITFGIEQLAPGRKKDDLRGWFQRVVNWFENRTVFLDQEAMLEWGRLRARTKRSLPVIDSLLAASALSRRLTILTRNTKDFEGIEGLSLLNPWE
jgi:predicted nucleic acid-binding protein